MSDTATTKRTKGRAAPDLAAAPAITVDVSKLIIDDLPLLIEFQQVADRNMTPAEQAMFVARVLPMIKRLCGDDIGQRPMQELAVVVATVMQALGGMQTAGN